jgi:hypothetical protein
MTMPAPATFVGKPRDPVTAVYYDGDYQNGNLLDIKAWLESIAPEGYTISYDEFMPFVLGVLSPDNKYASVDPGSYVFQILFTPQV